MQTTTENSQNDHDQNVAQIVST